LSGAVEEKALANATKMCYTYDELSRVTSCTTKTTNGVTIKYMYGRGLIGEETNRQFKTYHFDFHGSTLAITNGSGSIIRFWVLII
jgi:hypothetical protein